jgi:transcriptional regulator with XRE-family HTH domain
MRQRRLKHRELAEIAGVSKAAVGKWLRGTTPGGAELFKIARALGVPMESFFDAIPYVEPPIEALCHPLYETPVDFLSPKARKDVATMLELMSTPQGIEAYRQITEILFRGVGAPQAADEKTSKQVLTSISVSANVSAMQSEIKRLRDRLNRATAAKGMKTQLAAKMGVPLPCISDWLSGKREPAGDTTLRLLHWVEQQERQQNKSADSVSPPPAPKTQSKASNEKKPKSSPQER